MSAVSGGVRFSDVADSAYYANAVAWASENELVQGYGDQTFGPHDPVTREQLSAILYRYAAWKGADVSRRADLSAYTDAAAVSPYAREALQWANAEGLITGTSPSALSPQATAERAQLAAILMRLCQSSIV